MMSDILDFGGNGVDKHVGRQLRLYRLARRYSVEDVSKNIGISSSLLSQYETGLRRIAAPHIFAFCQMYTIQPADLFDGFSKAMSNSKSYRDKLIDRIETMSSEDLTTVYIFTEMMQGSRNK